MDAGRKLGFYLVCFIALFLAALALSIWKRLPERKGFSNMSMTDAQDLIEKGGDFIIVDVRTAEEFSSGHIPGAINIPVDLIQTEQKKHDRVILLPDTDRMILVYCRSGIRAIKACSMLAEMGYTNVYCIGGIINWNGETVEGS